MPRAWIVTDLGWGDSGKGTTVDFLVRETGAKLVVRWNGGAQAGHRVVTDDGRAHVFSQLGAGTFVPGVRTHLAETVLFDPLALQVEAARLGASDALARLTIASSARVVTTYHVAANRLRESARGDARHGSCGAGIGETVRDSLEHPDDVVRARHLVGPRAELQRLLARVQERLIASLAEPDAMLATPHHDDDAYLDRLCSIGEARVVADDAIDRELLEEVVLEGAQGVLLDQDVGITPPHVTWSRCTSHAAQEWLDAHGAHGERRALGVTRTYSTRHGAGPFPNEEPALASRLPEAESWNDFQGAFRVGALDLDRLRYAIAASPIDALVITHLDRLGVLAPDRVESDWLAWLARELNTAIAITSRGPRASDKRWLSISP
jgi:adenylosuccinate synthase